MSSRFGIDGVRRCQELHARRDLASRADPDRRDIEHHAVVVDEGARADREVPAVVAPERRSYDHTVAHLAEQFPQQRVA
jgi:hypothetical protein